jgi:hypothetical protein
MSLIYRKVILIKDNLAKRNWQGSKTCVLDDTFGNLAVLLQK